MTAPARGIILSADDFALSQGICDAVVALAENGRLSATTAIVTTDAWPRQAKRIGGLRAHIAVGLHLNLTYGAPLGAMPRLAPGGELPAIDRLIGRAAARNLDPNEIGDEIRRQLDRFEDAAGAPPDLVDGHHHVHVLPGLRDALLGELARRYAGRPLMVRDPSDRPMAILRRRHSAGKALAVGALALGMGRRIEAAGFVANRGFSGFSSFGAVPYAEEFVSFVKEPGPRPMIMCHPGLVDSGTGIDDDIAGRRPEEYETLANMPDLPGMLWRPTRTSADALAFAKEISA